MSWESAMRTACAWAHRNPEYRYVVRGYRAFDGEWRYYPVVRIR